MGVLVVLGTAVVIGVIIHRIYSQVGSPPEHASPAPGVSAPKPGSASKIFDRVIAAGQGASIGGLTSADGRIAIWVKNNSGGEIVLVDPSTGQTTGRIRLGTGSGVSQGTGGR